MTPELLAPAGSLACADAAFAHGADAVYAGIENFNLRAHSPNFSIDEFCELQKTANSLNKKVYVTLNIMPNDEMLAGIEKLLDGFANRSCLPNAFIVSDPGVLSAIKKKFANTVDIHLSTQSGCFNAEAMRFWKASGVCRVILPRELTIEQIKVITSQNIMQTEIFCHGAMCVSVAGRCLLGTYYNKRHPNFGDCPQPCRFKYKIVPIETDGVCAHDGFDIEEFEKGAYLLNSKDLCTIEILPQIINAGVASLKIEGRNKSAHYVASAVKVYRDAIDTYISDPQNYKIKEWWTAELESVEHRPYTTGFYVDDPVKQELFSSKAHADYKLVGIVKAVVDGVPIVDVKNSFDVSPINVLPVRRGQVPFDLTFDNIKEYGDGEKLCGIPRARANRLIMLNGASEKLRVGDMLRIKVK